MCDKRKTEGPDMYHFSIILLNALQRKNSLFTCIRKVPKCLKLMRLIEFVLCVMCSKIRVLVYQDRMLAAARRKQLIHGRLDIQ